MYSCPSCGAEEIAGLSTCDRCGASLSLLMCLDSVADAWFNKALEALRDDAPGRALEWLSASCAARPTDAEARQVQAKVWGQLGRWNEAREALARAAQLDPDAAELAELKQALEEGSQAELESAVGDQAPRPA